jgi:hypothetical protein
MSLSDACSDFTSDLIKKVPIKKAAKTLLEAIESYKDDGYSTHFTMSLRGAAKEVIAGTEFTDMALWLAMLAETTRAFLDTLPDSRDVEPFLEGFRMPEDMPKEARLGRGWPEKTKKEVREDKVKFERLLKVHQRARK